MSQRAYYALTQALGLGLANAVQVFDEVARTLSAEHRRGVLQLRTAFVEASTQLSPARYWSVKKSLAETFGIEEGETQ